MSPGWSVFAIVSKGSLQLLSALAGCTSRVRPPVGGGGGGGGAALPTVTLRLVLVVVFPAASRARALRLWAALVAVVVSQLTL